jgi:hypothetical protein
LTSNTISVPPSSASSLSQFRGAYYSYQSLIRPRRNARNDGKCCTWGPYKPQPPFQLQFARAFTMRGIVWDRSPERMDQTYIVQALHWRPAVMTMSERTLYCTSISELRELSQHMTCAQDSRQDITTANAPDQAESAEPSQALAALRPHLR